MAQRRKPTTTKKPASRRPLPTEFVLLTRERIQELFDDAVARGRMTRADATELVAELLRRSRRAPTDIVSDVEQLLGRSRENLEDMGRRTRDRARRAATAPFPIEDYDELTAAQVSKQLGDLTPGELRSIRDHERRNANRKSVLNAIEQRLG